MSRYGPRIVKELPAHVRREREGDCPEHRKFVRSQRCVVDAFMCGGPMHAHHVRMENNAGVGMKPHDKFCVPLCAIHHMELHNWGVETFEAHHIVDLAAEAEKLASRSPALRRLEKP